MLLAVIKVFGRGHGAGVRSATERPDSDTAAPSADLSESLPDVPARDFSALVRAEIDFVWRQLRRLGLSRADADDATQQVFMVASRRRSELVVGKERSFLYGTAVRVAANVRRSLQRRREVAEPSVESPLDAASPDAPLPDELVERRRARALLDALLEQLPAELARVLVLAEVEQLTLAAIAELEGIPAGTAASRLRRARAAFRELLERHPASAERSEP
ncbi:MAG TPA: sigma-70 family RNA polymerase sigma factor [Polyangiaceae bacterium]|nr:sigma-70 family RNA polymerase sigma factor [Polyangiaceae bacterium]